MVYAAAFAITLLLVITRLIPLAVSIPLWVVVMVGGVVHFGRKAVAERRRRGSGNPQ
ncbi:hypothetical protein AB0I60_02820 [Actinosynnema sp. NPDC050436]|uniref:hypothetical protein n=1 Tax=Actinosynnema sp. NPDC050436 TaxID=3155659 RepID=UPI0033F6E753